MIKRAVETIKNFCSQENPEFLMNDRDRHRFSVRAKDGLLSYVFSVPVRRKTDGELVDLTWREGSQNYELNGTLQDSVIQVFCDSIVLKSPRQ